MHEIRQQTKVIAIGHLNDSDNLKILFTFYNKCVRILLSTLWIKQRENQRNIKTKKKLLTPETPPPQEKPLQCKKTTTTYRLYHRFLKFLLPMTVEAVLL